MTRRGVCTGFAVVNCRECEPPDRSTIDIHLRYHFGREGHRIESPLPMVRLHSTICLAILCVVALASATRQCHADDAVSATPSYTDVRAVLDRYCIDCHQGETAEAGLTLDLYQPELASTRDREIWKKVLVRVDAGIMPPPDSEQLSDSDRTTLLRWLREVALHVDCTGPAYPGRVTVRRLNRTEYGYTIADLLGIEVNISEELPNDDVGYGFDHIGDVLTLPPALLDRYLAVADLVVREAIVVADEEQAPVQTHDGRTLASTGEVGRDFEFNTVGEYILRVVASADQAGPDLAQMGIRWRDDELKVVEITGNDEENTYEVRVPVDQAGAYRFAASFLNDYYRPDDDDPALRGDRNLHVRRLEVVGPIGVLPENLPESHRRIFVETPAADAGREEQLRCARTILEQFAGRAWRRPISDDEAIRLTGLVDFMLEEGSSFERSIQFAIQGILVSPNFLFRVEQEPTAEHAAGIRELNSHELATRLSYFLWRSLPDDELRAVADAGRLTDDAELRRQVERMLDDPKSARMTADFCEQWLQLRLLDVVSPNGRRYERFNDNLRQAMREETLRFFNHIVAEDRPLTELLSADYTFVNQQLAELYGMTGVEGEEFRLVQVDTTQRGGLLGHASILTITSNPTRTSPVKRGKWVLDNLLDAPPPPPPANVPPLEAVETDRETPLRERMEIHRRNPACAACHQLMDPIGFGLENYDAIGAWRTDSRDVPIEATGTLPDGRSFNGPAELRQILLERAPELRRCIANKLLTFALGRGLEYFDECTLIDVTQTMEREGDTFRSAVMSIVLSRPFRMQSAERFPE